VGVTITALQARINKNKSKHKYIPGTAKHNRWGSGQVKMVHYPIERYFTISTFLVEGQDRKSPLIA
jgi:hypothetical protein